MNAFMYPILDFVEQENLTDLFVKYTYTQNERRGEREKERDRTMQTQRRTVRIAQKNFKNRLPEIPLRHHYFPKYYYKSARHPM